MIGMAVKTAIELQSRRLHFLDVLQIEIEVWHACPMHCEGSSACTSIWRHWVPEWLAWSMDLIPTTEH